jgi:hypothetical protein
MDLREPSLLCRPRLVDTGGAQPTLAATPSGNSLNRCRHQRKRRWRRPSKWQRAMEACSGNEAERQSHGGGRGGLAACEGGSTVLTRSCHGGRRLQLALAWICSGHAAEVAVCLVMAASAMGRTIFFSTSGWWRGGCWL